MNNKSLAGKIGLFSITRFGGQWNKPPIKKISSAYGSCFSFIIEPTTVTPSLGLAKCTFKAHVITRVFTHGQPEIIRLKLIEGEQIVCGGMS